MPPRNAKAFATLVEHSSHQTRFHMIGKLLTTTGLLLVLSTAANAQAAGRGASPADGTNGAPAATSSTTAAANAGGGAVNVSGLHPSDMAAIKVDDLKGVDVLNPSGETIASITGIVLQQDGKVDAVIVDFGGFLGIGSTQIALGYDGLQFMDDGNGKHYLVVNTTKDQLNAQPAYNK